MTDTIRDLGPNDLDLVQDVLHYYPGVREVLSLVKAVEGTGYPVNSLEELLSDLPDPFAEFRFAGRTYNHAAARRFMPAFYFPIASRSDLIAKLVELHRISRTMARRRAAAPGLQPRKPS